MKPTDKEFAALLRQMRQSCINTGHAGIADLLTEAADRIDALLAQNKA